MTDYQPIHDQHAVVFDGTRINDLDFAATGTGVIIDGIAGWDDGVEVRDVREPRPGFDGEDADASFMGGRTFTLSGRVAGSSWANLKSRARALAAKLPPSSAEAVLKVPDADATALEAGTYYDMVQSLDPVGYWRLGDAVGSATAADSSGNGYTGTLAGNPVFGATGALADSTDTALDFDGTGDYVNVPYAAALNPAAFTLSCWVYRDTDTGAGEYIASSMTATTGFYLSLNSSDKPQFLLGPSGAFLGSVGTTSVATGAWYHLVGVYDGTNTIVYVNGVAEDTDARSYTANASGALRIGAASTGTTNLWPGKIDEVSLHASALTAAQILALYNQGLSGFSRELSNWERSSCKVVEPIAFGAVEGFTQEWQVSLRASDPRIYSDVETTGAWSFALSSYTGGVPVKLTASLGNGSDLYGYATSSVGTNYARTTVPATWDTAAGTYTTQLDWVIDGRERESYYLLPQNFARTAMLDPVWVYWLRDAGGTADNAQGTAAYDGTINGAPTTNQAGPATDMESILFDGVNDSVSRAWSADLFPAEWTFETYLKTSSSGIAVDYTGGSTTAGLRVYSATSGAINTVYAEVGDGTSLVNVGTGYSASTSFTHVALTYRSGVVTMYVNGSSIGRTRLTYSEPTSGTYYLGRTNAGVFWAGSISTTGVYSVAYPASVIEDIYNSGAAQSACRYKSGTYVDVTTWPTLTANTTINLVGNVDNERSTYRTVRL